MGQEQTFWKVECEEGEPDLLVCMSCLNEVFLRKVPMPDCPTCHGVSTYEAFSLESIRDWGTEELIEKAERANANDEQEAREPTHNPESEVSEI
ncbi:MAG TPA: hypothetical protein VJ692_01530 [Nitrospiraceae bacterium]|nr:hypothetical protein [Nitrospiraceae bacterium]